MPPSPALWGVLLGAGTGVAETGSSGLGLPEDIRWADFLAGSDLIWHRMPQTWYEGPFLGNALLGSGIYAQPGATAVRFNVQHSQVQDHRPEFGSLFGLARLPIGHLTLEPVGAITAVDWRLDLWNAELRGTITTAAGSLDIRALAHNFRLVLVVEVVPSDGESGFQWVFHPEEAISPRANPVFNRPPPAGYTGNPAPSVERHRTTMGAALTECAFAGVWRGGWCALCGAASQCQGRYASASPIAAALCSRVTMAFRAAATLDIEPRAAPWARPCGQAGKMPARPAHATRP